MFSRSGKLKEAWRLGSEWGDYDGAKDAMVAKASKVGHCYCGDGYFVGT